jgi:hypothetical protein
MGFKSIIPARQITISQTFRILLWTLCFSRAKNLRFEDYIYLLPPPLVGVRFGKICLVSGLTPGQLKQLKKVVEGEYP